MNKTFTLLLLLLGISNAFAQSDSIDIYSMDLSALMDLKVESASKKSESLFDAPLSISIITKQDLINSGALSIPEALRLSPEVIVREKTNGNYDVHLRGFDNILADKRMNSTENTSSLVMIDGRVVYSYFQGGTFWETLPISVDDIEKIEIIRGPSSAMYGPNAVNGVINITTRKTSEKKSSVTAHGVAGTQKTIQANINASHKFNSLVSAGVYANFNTRNRYEESVYITSRNVYMPYDSLDHMRNSYGMPAYSKGASLYYPNRDLSTKTYAGNAFVSFAKDENKKATVSFGQQQSQSQIPYMGTYALPTTRESGTRYVNLEGTLNHLHASGAYTYGTQSLVVGNPDFKYDLAHIDGLIEYDLNVKNLSIRPGISYFSATYDVSKYNDATKMEGYFRNAQTLSTIAGLVRADYKLLNDKIRIIGAARADKFKNYNDLKLSYQGIITGKITENHIIRASYSLANKSPFMLDSYSEYYISMGKMGLRIEGTPSGTIASNKTFEIGYRAKIASKIQIDLDGYMSTISGFMASITDMKKMSMVQLNGPMAPPIPVFSVPYQAIPTNAEQIGVSLNITTFVNKDLNIKLFGTFQKTKIKSLIPDIETKPSVTVDVDHKWTPQFYGGGSIQYNFLKKAYINVGLYAFAEQSMPVFNNTITVSKQALINMKLAYKVYNESEIYVSVKNIGSNSTQFVGGEQIKPWIGGGVAFRL